MSQTTTLATLRQSAPVQPDVHVGFDTVAGFESLQRMARLFNKSSLVPTAFQGDANIGNSAIALDMAIRMRANPLMVMQNLYIVHGRPAWSAQFLIATLNQCGRFSSIRYEFQGEEGKDDWGCRAVATELATGEKLAGPLITIGLAKKEGWFGKNGSKWQTMPELMLRYRAASWFVRAYAPEIAMGLKTADEVQDTFDLEPAEDGTYRVSVQEMKEEAKAVEAVVQPAEPAESSPEPTKRSRPTNAEMDARRKEAADAWLATGNPLEDVETLVNCYKKNWTTAQCEKVKQLGAEAMQSGAQQPDHVAESGNMIESPEPQGSEAQAHPAEPADEPNIVTCPKSGASVSDWTCSDCEQRAGCPAWAE